MFSLYLTNEGLYEFSLKYFARKISNSALQALITYIYVSYVLSMDLMSVHKGEY